MWHTDAEHPHRIASHRIALLWGVALDWMGDGAAARELLLLLFGCLQRCSFGPLEL
jgi:hypothetical protein